VYTLPYWVDKIEVIRYTTCSGETLVKLVKGDGMAAEERNVRVIWDMKEDGWPTFFIADRIDGTWEFWNQESEAVRWQYVEPTPALRLKVEKYLAGKFANAEEAATVCVIAA